MEVELTHFRDKIESYVSESIDTIAFHMSAQKMENDAVSQTCLHPYLLVIYS